MPIGNKNVWCPSRLGRLERACTRNVHSAKQHPQGFARATAGFNNMASTCHISNCRREGYEEHWTSWKPRMFVQYIGHQCMGWSDEGPELPQHWVRSFETKRGRTEHPPSLIQGALLCDQVCLGSAILSPGSVTAVPPLYGHAQVTA